MLAGTRAFFRRINDGGGAGSRIIRVLSSLLGQPQRRELADGLAFPEKAVLTRCDDEDRPVAVIAEVSRPRDPGHPPLFHDRITADFSVSPIGRPASLAIGLPPALASSPP